MIRRAALVTVVLAVGMGLSVAHSQAQHLPSGIAGLWETELSVAVSNGEIEKAAASAPAAPSGAPAGGPSPAELALFKRVQLWQKPPYNPQWEQKLQGARKPPAAGGPGPLLKFCTPDGFPAVMEGITPDAMFQVVITQSETLFLFPDGELRQIYTDGRSHPGRDDLWPTLMGDSIGHWAGATLVIDTVARKAGPITAIPIPGMAVLSDQAFFTERVRLIDANTLQNDLTINDPQRFSHPWQVSVRYRRVTDVNRMITTNCTDNDRDKIVDGKQTIAEPPTNP
ncbi:MAG TPA: hypothetical protein VGV09_08960 [Steroidobacteraceae bacterium]|nr:hypothetical protein [Steroidobacteraceae bacterium]